MTLERTLECEPMAYTVRWSVASPSRSSSILSSLTIRAIPEAEVVVKNLKVQNEGWELEALRDGENAPEELAIRGYRLVKKGERCLVFDKPGTYVINE